MKLVWARFLCIKAYGLHDIVRIEECQLKELHTTPFDCNKFDSKHMKRINVDDHNLID